MFKPFTNNVTSFQKYLSVIYPLKKFSPYLHTKLFETLNMQSQFTLGRITVMHNTIYSDQIISNDTKDTASQWLPGTAEKNTSNVQSYAAHLREWSEQFKLYTTNALKLDSLTSV